MVIVKGERGTRPAWSMSHSSLDQHAVNCAAASVRIAKGAVRKAHRPQDRDMEAIECLSIEIQGLPRFKLAICATGHHTGNVFKVVEVRIGDFSRGHHRHGIQEGALTYLSGFELGQKECHLLHIPFLAGLEFLGHPPIGVSTVVG